MTAANRATRIGKLHTLLKKAYKPTLVSENRPLIEHLLYACLLENAPYELADEALARLEQDYFDWNEVRVTTITELAEVLGRLPDPTAAAIRLKKNLHGLFESTYSFDLEELRKQNLGKALQKFEKLPAITPFVLSYLTQLGLGGHSIPLDSAALRFFWLCDIINENELKSGKVTGLERAIPKSKGLEFSSLLHQAAVALNIDPNNETARGIVLALNPDLDQKVADHVANVKQRRAAKAAAAEAEAAEESDEAAEKPKSAKSKSAKSAEKASEKATGKSSSKSTSKTALPKDESKPAKSSTKKAAAQPSDDAAVGDLAEKVGSEKTAATKPSKSTKAKSSDKKLADDGGKPEADKTPVVADKPKKTDGGSKKVSKKASSDEAPKKSSKSAAAKDDANSGDDAGTKTSSKKVSKRKPR